MIKKVEIDVKLHDTYQHPVAEGKGSIELNSAKDDQEPETMGVYRTSWLTQFKVLTQRSLKTISRDFALTRARLMQSIVLGIFAGLIYLNAGRENNQKSIQNINGAIFFVLINQSISGIFGVMQTFPLELPMFQREHKAQMYSPSAFFLARSISDIPFQLLLPTIFVSIVYYFIGLNPPADRFFGFLGTILLTANAAFSLGYAISAVAPTVGVALAIAPLIMMPLLIFGGFFVNTDSIPKYFIWLEYMSFFKYGFEAIVVNEWNGKTIGCDTGEICALTSGAQVIQSLGLNADNFGRDLGVLAILLIGFRVIAYLFLLRRSRQREQ